MIALIELQQKVRAGPKRPKTAPNPVPAASSVIGVDSSLPTVRIERHVEPSRVVQQPLRRPAGSIVDRPFESHKTEMPLPLAEVDLPQQEHRSTVKRQPTKKLQSSRVPKV